jgi:uncharacterized Ntn-hydrolase superfamily protein
MKTHRIILAGLLGAGLLVTLRGGVASPMGEDEVRDVNTFSVVGFDPATGDLGVAVESKFFAVGAVVPWVECNVGAIATQAAANTAYGPDGLALLKSGKTAKEVVEALTDPDTNATRRQIGVVDAKGNAATFTGTNCGVWAGGIQGDHFCVQGNLLAGEAVVKGMKEGYEKARAVEGSELADWLVAALQAGQEAGGDKRGRQSAALIVMREKAGYNRLNDRYIDLHVEDHPEPIQELSRLLEMHKQFDRPAHRNKPKREVK